MKSHPKIFVFTIYIGYIAINIAKPLYLVINKINGYLEKSIGNKCLTLGHTDECRDSLKKLLLSKQLVIDLFRFLILLHSTEQNQRSIQINCLLNSKFKNLDNYNENYVRIKFNSDDDLHLRKMLELYNMIIVVRSFFHKDNKYYS